jgi:VanZ family protein
MEKIFLFFEKHGWICWSLTIIYMIMIFYFSSLSYFPPGTLPAAKVSDLLKHAVLYFGLGVLFFFSYKSIKNANIKNKAFLLALVSTILYGISDEIHQLFVPNRVCSFYDIIANSFGAFLGVGIMYLIRKKFKSRKLQDIKKIKKVMSMTSSS